MTTNLEIPKITDTELSELVSQLNQQLNLFEAPNIGRTSDSIKRSKQFMLFNEWLQKASDDLVHDLANDYGLLIVVLAVTGINQDHVVLLQKASKPDYTGFIRYIDAAILNATQYKAKNIRFLSKRLLNDELLDLKTPEVRSHIISEILERYINMNDNYVNALNDLQTWMQL